MSFALSASLRASSSSALHGTIIVSGCASCILLRFSLLVFLSILFAASSIGLLFFRMNVQKDSRLFSSHCMRFSGCSLSASLMWLSVTRRPLSFSSSTVSGFIFSCCILLASLCQSFCSTVRYHWLSSSSRNCTSVSGSWLPGLTSSPSSFTLPLVSMMCMSASASFKSLRNASPLPRPLCAPGTSPATSMSSNGTYRLLFVHHPVLGLHCVCSSLSTQGIFMCANPVFASIVVNG